MEKNGVLPSGFADERRQKFYEINKEAIEKKGRIYITWVLLWE